MGSSGEDLSSQCIRRCCIDRLSSHDLSEPGFGSANQLPDAFLFARELGGEHVDFFDGRRLSEQFAGLGH